MDFDREKFKNLIHYIVWKISGRDGFGATKLYKVLWFSEARSFLLYQQPIAGAVYIREKHGPVPRLGMQIRDELVHEGKISQRQVNRGKYQEWVFGSKMPPPINFLSENEREIVDWWIEHIDKDHTASSISDLSHDYAWEIARQGEELPFHAFLSSRLREPTEAELRSAKDRAKALGLI